jgi:archaellum biogenesis ATPase FlaH
MLVFGDNESGKTLITKNLVRKTFNVSEYSTLWINCHRHLTIKEFISRLTKLLIKSKKDE